MTPRIIEKIGGISTIVFPVMLLAGFLMHPDILSLEITDSAEALAMNFHHQPLFHYGHLIVFFAVPCIIISLFCIMLTPVQAGRNWVLYGGLLGIFGAVILAGDKGALCIVLSAFDTLDEVSFKQIYPALTAIVNREGLLVIFYLLPLLTLGAAFQFVGLMRGGTIKVLSGLAGIIGLLLLNNPDIEIISSAGAVLMGTAYIPLGIRMYKGTL